MNRFALLLVVLTVAGCSPVFIRRNATHKIEPHEREAVLSRALSSMQRRGWIVAVSDRAAGLLTTQAMLVSSARCGLLSFCAGRQTLQVSATPDGTVIVNLHEERFEHGFGRSVGYWFVPSDRDSVARIEADQAAILAEIVGRPPAVRPSE